VRDRPLAKTARHRPGTQPEDWLDPPFNIVRLPYVEQMVNDLDVSRAFYAYRLGL
jgi:hypothetical protein